MEMQGELIKYCSSHLTFCQSMWLVGSSRRKISGFSNTALARANFILQPSEREVIGASNYCYEVWMGEVRGGKMKEYKKAKEETCVY